MSMGLKPFTCSDYRQEMMLVGLKRQLAVLDLDEAEKRRLEAHIRRLEEALGLD